MPNVRESGQDRKCGPIASTSAPAAAPGGGCLSPRLPIGSGGAYSANGYGKAHIRGLRSKLTARSPRSGIAGGVVVFRHYTGQGDLYSGTLISPAMIAAFASLILANISGVRS